MCRRRSVDQNRNMGPSESTHVSGTTHHDPALLRQKGSDDMLSARAKELLDEARSCLELAKITKECYAKNALMELARDLSREAHQAERRRRDLAALFHKNGRASAT